MSPLFHDILPNPVAMTVRVRMEPDLPRAEMFNPKDIAVGYSGTMRAAVALLRLNLDVEVSDVVEAEKLVFDYADTTKITLNQQSCSFAALPIHINRAANQIAARSRRGAGNVVFLHPSAIPLITELRPLEYLLDHDDQGRWKYEGKLHGALRVYSCPDLSENEIFVAFVNGQDGPAFLSKDQDGYRLGFLPTDSTYLGSGKDYIIRLEF